jgi:hypothetical protein
MGYIKGENNGGFPFAICNRIIEGFNVPYFVETGTAGAFSITQAAEVFKECHTIELIEGRTPFSKQIVVVDEEDPTIVEYPFVPIEYPSNITFHVGDSVDILPKIVKSIADDYAVFWLDAHYSDEIPAPDDCVECPIIEELESIRKCKKAIIIIDDARLFLGSPPYPLNPKKWATLQEIFDCIRKNFPKHNFTIVDDYIIAVPDEMKSNLFNEWLDNYEKRYP